MKAINYFLKGRGLLIQIPFLLLAVTIGCTKQDAAPEVIDDMNFKSLVIADGPVTLEGVSGFGFFAEKEKIVLADPYANSLPCTAELTFGDKQSFVLHTKEYFGPDFMYREVFFNGKITPGGQLKFSYPMTFTEFDFEVGDYVVKTVGILPEMRLHTGCVFHGPGINAGTLNFVGYFDGNRLYADMHIIGLQEVPGQMPFLANMVDGPIKLNFLFDLVVSD